MARKQWRTLAFTLAAFALCSIFLAACIRPGTVTSSGSSAPAAPACASGTTVKTSTNNFEQSCISLKKGETLTVAQDQASYHVLDFGQWNGSTAQPATPGGAPALKDLKLSGSSVQIGPFTTAGTFNIYCTVHPGMNLTVIVK
jgi:plastocyanin